MGRGIVNLRFVLDRGRAAPKPIVDIPLFFLPAKGQRVHYIDDRGACRRAVVAEIVERPGAALTRDVVLRLMA